jgi:hypothetical protein
MAWWDFFKVWTYAFTDDPISRSRAKGYSGAGFSQSEAIPDNRSGMDGNFGSAGAGSIRLRDTNDFVDLSTVTNRIHRYKEYERLRNMAEIEMAMTVFADEACLSGTTKVATPHGFRTLKDLAENEKDRFLVYCYDAEKQDYTLSWAYNPRKTKKAKTLRVLLDDGSEVICTPDHRILMRDGKWKEAGQIFLGEELMPFYRIQARQDLTNIKTNQFPRIYTHNKGWIHERQFVDEWTTGKERKDLEPVNKYCRMIAAGLGVRAIAKLTDNECVTIKSRIEKAGFSNKEMKWLGQKSDHRRVVGVWPHEEMDVYDLSVDKHKNFATDWGIVHNCQKDDDGKVMQIQTNNVAVKEELEYLIFHRKMLNFDQKKLWNVAKQLFIYGDFFWEIVIDVDDPKTGILNLVPLPPDSMYRIETTKGRLVEFQQSKDGPDYESLARVDVTQATEGDLQQSKAIRFSPEQVIHVKIGDDRKTFYPYGISLIEAARGPAQQLRLMEDAMVVYRLTRAPERRVFYIDVQQLPPYKAEAFIERMKDQFKKKKVPARGNMPGASAVEERWHAPAADEDYWIPIRPNANTRVETLPGAQNLGEIDDTVYFRNKLFTALNFPRNYFNNEDTQSTRIALSAQDIKFARLIERLQSHMEDAFWCICDRHLRLLGYPEEVYEDLVIKMTPPSDWRELTRAEVITNRLNNAANLKGSQLMADYDIMTKWLKYSDEEAKKMLARLKIQKLEDLKLQIIAQNPTLLGVGLPGENETEVGTEPGGPSPMLGPDMGGGAPPMGGPPPMGGGAPPGGPMGGAPPMGGPPPMGMRKYMGDGDGEPTGTGDPEGGDPMGGAPVGGPMGGPPPAPNSGGALPDPSKEEIKKYDLDIRDFEKEMDEPEVDYSEIE